MLQRSWDCGVVLCGVEKGVGAADEPSVAGFLILAYQLQALAAACSDSSSSKGASSDEQDSERALQLLVSHALPCPASGLCLRVKEWPILSL
jgi:hypothetical protein